MLRHLGNYALNQTEPFQMSVSKAIHKEDSKISFVFQDSDSHQRVRRLSDSIECGEEEQSSQ